MTRRWCHCGAPLWRTEENEGLNKDVDDANGCRLCGLSKWSSFDVVNGYKGDVSRVCPTTTDPYDDYVYHWPRSEGADNSTDDSPATSRWLPNRHRLHPTPEHADACAASGNFDPVGPCDCDDGMRYEALLDWWDAAYGPRLTLPTS